MTRARTESGAAEPRRGLLARFARDTRGGFATMLAVTAIPMIAMAGIGVDVARVLSARTDLQAATDNSALALARQPAGAQLPNLKASGACPGGTLADLSYAPSDFQTQACNWVLTNFSRSDVSHLVITPTATSTQVAVGGEADVTTTLSGIIGVKTIHIKVNSVVNRNVTHVELALVLDNTGSMLESDGSGSTKSATLKSASTALIDALSTSAKSSGQSDTFQVAMVPFATYVNIKKLAPNLNVATSSTWPSWMPGTSDYANDIFPSGTNRYALLNNMKTTWSGCVESRPMPYDVNDTAPNASTAGTRFTPFFAPDEPDYQYVGQSGSPDLYVNNYLADGIDDGNNWQTRQQYVKKYTGGTPSKPRSNYWGVDASSDYGPNRGCPAVYAQPLTTDYAGVESAIQALSPAGNTHIPFGLAWGWYMLSPNMPFGNKTAYTDKTVYKIAVLVTDGSNTYNVGYNYGCYSYDSKTGKANGATATCAPSAGDYSDTTGYGYVWQNRIARDGSSTTDVGNGDASNPQVSMNDRLVRLCRNMQAKGVILYTIPLLVTDANTKTMLQNCASPSNVGPPGVKYLEAQTGSQLTAAFANIAGQISALRVYR